MKDKEYICKCGKRTEYGIWYCFETKEFNIDSCCGGGCYAGNDIKYCPYCGIKLKEGKK